MAPGRITTLPQPNTSLSTWSGLAGSENGDAASTVRWQDKTVQCTGTFTSITIQGSNDGTNWGTLSDAQGVDLVITVANEVRTILENPLYIRPVSVGAAGCVVLIAGSQS